MSQARSNAAARVRQSGPFIFDCLESFKDAEKRAEQFRNDIGFTTVDGVSRYESFAPILYKIDPIQTAPKWTIFRNPILMRVCIFLSHTYFWSLSNIIVRHAQHCFGEATLSKEPRMEKSLHSPAIRRTSRNGVFEVLLQQ